ncbi:hypothetical protein [Flavivirga sp. 57AJ16]|uniref:hypothetical protein n=1 Tax=Flavivirga sp. 57AJ16 TaxID=3025307 RepID=UPI00236699E2|nr:hypothetical protein [Flavivirga sp. 57AJ16]MDD7885620.1 hypothetical protein [Flavivirga sp. 57AJ16]
MKIKEITLLILLVFFNCKSYNVIAQEKYSVVISFIGKDFEKKTIDVSFNDILAFKNLNLGERMYPVGLYEFAFGFEKNNVDLYRLRNGQILKSKRVLVNNLEKLKITIKIDERIVDNVIYLNKGKNYHLEYHEGKIKLIPPE